MMNRPLGDVEASFSHASAYHAFESLTDDQEEATLRIRFYRDQRLVELRRYVGGADGKVWTKKCMTLGFNLEEIPQAELAKLDEVEKDGLTQLLKFSEACKLIEDLGVLDQVSVGQRLTELPRAKVGDNFNSLLDTVAPFVSRQPKELSSKLSLGRFS